MLKRYSEHELLGHPLSDLQKQELLALMDKPDEDIDVSDIPEIREIPPGASGSPFRQRPSHRYAIVIERRPGGSYRAYAPDLPDCVATAQNIDDVKKLIREVIEDRVEGMRKDGRAIPESRTEVDYVEAPAA